MRKIICKDMPTWLDKMDENIDRKIQPCVDYDNGLMGFVVTKHKNVVEYFIDVDAYHQYRESVKIQKKVLKFFKKSKKAEDAIDKTIQYFKSCSL